MTTEEANIDVAAVQQRLRDKGLLADGAKSPDTNLQFAGELLPGKDKDAMLGEEPKPAPKPRRTRSDAGKPRPKPAPAEPKQETAGGITQQQWARLGVLIEQSTQAVVNLRDSRERSDRANAELSDYLDSLRSVPRA